MKKLALYIVLMLPLTTTLSASLTLSEQDQKAIKATASNYANGWYSGDKDRMASSLHPSLAKRAYLAGTEGKRQLHEMSAEILVAGTVTENIQQYANTAKRAEIEILDGFGQVATVKLQMNDWVDYMHMIRLENGDWRIINVLWEFNENYKK